MMCFDFETNGDSVEDQRPLVPESDLNYKGIARAAG